MASIAPIPRTQKGVKVSKQGIFIRDIPVPEPRDNEVLIKNQIVSSNPKDWKHVTYSDADIVQGNDTVGTIVRIGCNVENFKIGDYVVGFTPQRATLGEGDRFGCHAEYTVTSAATVFHMPPNKEAEEIVTLPLAIMTTSLALFSPENLGLNPPYSLPSTHHNQKTIVINGASSSLGSFAVQLSKIAGYRVVGIAGGGGEYVKMLKADVVVDYRGKSKDELAQEIISHGDGDDGLFEFGYDCVSDLDSIEMLSRVIKPKSGQLATVNPHLTDDQVSQFLSPKNIVHKKVFVYDVFEESHARFCHDLFSWFPKALTDGTLRGNRYRVVPNGLSGIPEGLDLLRNGKVSAEKLVYRINETPGLN